ncbi:hypothetical protein BCR35DRAFT_353366 [Leucosporidium creatinivorum]|uniref:F-box domain-containing protein n=1 Tax=Leucosporidium creatinivorum TaxID=106004 RepID=A0A1Y2EYA1_9BASI|nr:hypothetical protein BCR35DRAFT_353366 [Leucosporidium creatinivorum]
MAGWTDLPPELKEKIVLHLDGSSSVRQGEADADSPALQALKALRAVDRELYELTGVVLWQTLQLVNRTFEDLAYWTESIAPRRAHFVRQLIVHPEGPKGVSAEAALPFFIEALKRFPKITYLQLHAPSAFTSQLVDSLPSSLLEQITRLAISAGPSATTRDQRPIPENFLSVSVATQVLQALPNLVSISLVEIKNDDDPIHLISALQSLSSLVSLTTDDFRTFNHPHITAPWRSSLQTIFIGDDISYSRLFPFLAQHASTLIALTLPTFSTSQALPPYLPAPFPNLLSLELWSEPATADLPLLFAASPLQQLEVKIYDGGSESLEPLQAVRRAFEAMKPSLKRVELQVMSGGLDHEGEVVAMDLYREGVRAGVRVLIHGTHPEEA